VDKRKLAEKVAWSLHGLPYIWGGDDPVSGFDCSGLCIEILKSVGILPRSGDWTAQGLFSHFEPQRVNVPGLGCLVFFKKTYAHAIHHVEFCLDSQISMGASGGGSQTGVQPRLPPNPTEMDRINFKLDRLLWLSGDSATRHNAYTKVRPFVSRDDLYAFVDPFQRAT